MGESSEEALVSPPPPRLLQEHELLPILTAIEATEAGRAGEKIKSGRGGTLDTQHYGRGKRAREARDK